MLVVVRINGIGNKHLDRACGIAVESIHQNCIHRQSLINHIWLA